MISKICPGTGAFLGMVSDWIDLIVAIPLAKLVETGMERLSKMGVNVVFVYGDPQYYGKFGFSPDVASRYSPPCKLQYPFGWQAVTLNEESMEVASVKISCVASLSDPELW